MASPDKRVSRLRGLQQAEVPPALAGAAAWCWRILVVAAAFLALVLLFGKLTLVVVPILGALLITALLHPLVGFLRHHHWPRPLATWGTLIVAFAVICGVAFFVILRAQANYPVLVNEVSDLLVRLRSQLGQIPGLNPDQLQNLQNELIRMLREHQQTIATGLIHAGTLIGEIVTGVILMFFLTFFFLDDGDRIWSWIVRLFPHGVQPSIRGAGYRAWHVLSGWVVGTAIIAMFHGVVIGLALVMLGVPLAVPLAVLVFLGSFLPIVGAVLFGGLAVLVTLLTQGWVGGAILLGILVIENQVEAHLLQPFVVGRAVRLHPVAIVLALTGGGVFAGILGAIFAIPIVASASAAVKYLTGVEDVEGHPLHATDRMAPEPPPRSAPLPMYADHRRYDGDLHGSTVAQEDEGP